MNIRHAGFVLAGTALLLTTGCRVRETPHGDGKDVKIDTPFGDMSVKTNGSDVQAGVGLDLYPGAVPEKKKDHDDDHAADVNMSFGRFHLGVKAASYTTPDAPAKVMAFYRGQLARYGTVIQCRGKQPVGLPSTTSQGLTCDDDRNSHIHTGDHPDSDTHAVEMDLKAGSRTHQHVVELNPQDSGTKFALILLDLPPALDSGGDDKQ